ncbi:MAG: hypothetical protein H7A24_01915 [Leptospiraceae bacterium]|nr:hypothetical protein [Leptospiraceae bacterium]MCP5510606.1 hypothetical protein [Leptospiraceae bacterium]
MSLCQANQYSCGCCCGYLNLSLDRDELKEVLRERTRLFRNSVNFSVPWTIAEFRKEREKKELDFKRIDEQTYVCPFLGFIENHEDRIGCLIHPIASGDPLSQNFSFYGASICQGYDCKNKESEITELIKKMNEKVAESFWEYSILSADHRYWKFLLVEILSLFGKEESIQQEVLISKLLRFRLDCLKQEKKMSLTSFELEEEDFSKYREKIQDWVSKKLET